MPGFGSIALLPASAVIEFFHANSEYLALVTVTYSKIMVQSYCSCLISDIKVSFSLGFKDKAS